MIIILSSLALFVALTALWLASASLRKFEAGYPEIKKLIKANIKIVKAELEKKVTAITGKMKKYDARWEASPRVSPMSMKPRTQ